MLRTPRFLRAVALAAAIPAFAGCGVVDAIVAEDVVIASLVKTPDSKNPVTNATVPGIVTISVFFGKIDHTKITGAAAADGAFSANKQATMKLLFTDAGSVAQEITIPEKGEGTYALTSTEAQKLTYVEDGKYTLNVSFSGKQYSLAVQTPKPTKIAEFDGKNPPVIDTHDAGAEFIVTRLGGSDDTTKNDIAFVVAKPLADGKSEFTNAPADPLGFLRLVLDDKQWRAKSFKVPGATFEKGTPVLVTLTGLKKGGTEPGSPALFVSSAFLAGVADAGVVTPK